MADQVTVNVAQALASAAALGRRAGKAETAAKVILGKAANNLARAAQNAVPVDTGHLKSTIVPRASADGMEIDVTPTAHYWWFVEAGTSRMRPQPYIRAPYAAAQQQIAEALRQLHRVTR